MRLTVFAVLSLSTIGYALAADGTGGGAPPADVHDTKRQDCTVNRRLEFRVNSGPAPRDRQRQPSGPQLRLDYPALLRGARTPADLRWVLAVHR